MPLLQVRNLSVYFLVEGQPKLRAVDDVSFDLGAGESLGILGESGSGKTTLAQTLVGLVPFGARVTQGSVRFGADELLALPERELEQIRGAKLSLIFQEPGIALNPVMRAGEQVCEVIRAHRPWSRKRCREEADAALKEVFPGDAARIGSAYPHELSGGQRQRVAIAQALACRPALVIADEPTASLDTTTQAEILALVQELRRRHAMALIWITHNPAILVGLADRVLVMYAGRVAEEGPLERVYAQPYHPYTQALLSLMRNERGHGSAGPARLPAIPGSPPDPANPPPWCRFEPRCPERMDICRVREPEEVQAGNMSRVQCFKYGG